MSGVSDPVRDTQPAYGRLLPALSMKEMREAMRDPGEPRAFGPHHEPVGVLLSFEHYTSLVDQLDALAEAVSRG